MDTIASYNEWKAKQQQNGAGAAQVVLGSVDAKPDEIAGDLNLANDFGKATGNPVPPLPMVKEYRNVFQKRIEEARNKTILADAPRLSEWLINPDNAALSGDNIEGLSWFEGFGKGVANTAARAGQGLAQMGNQFMLEQTAARAADRKLTFGELLDDQKLVMHDMQGKPIDTGAGPVEYAGAFARWIDARYADLIGADDEAAAADFAGRMKASADAIKATPKSTIASAFEAQAMVDGATLGQAVSNFGSALYKNPIGGISWALETAGEMAPQLAAALGATAVTRNPMVGAAVGAGGSYATERYRSPAEFFTEKGLDLSKPDDVQKMLADPEIMREAAERGVIRGAIIGAFDAVSMGVAGASLAGNPIVEALAQGASQMILGGAGEYAARTAAGQEMDWSEVLAEALGELATTPVDMGVAGRKFIDQRRSSADAESRKAVFDELSGRAAVDPLRKRMPDKFREFVARATENGPVENVFVPAEQFSTYFQSIGVDPLALVDELDGMSRDDLEIALAGGGDLRIPTATYAARIAGTEHDAFLIENMRFDPNEFTSVEAAEFNAKAADAMDEAFELSEQLRRQEDDLRTFEQEIYDTMISRLRMAGRSTDIATTEAMLYPAFYRVMAERSGMGVDEFMARYPLPQVEGDRPEGLQTRNVDALNRTLAEARALKAIGGNRATPLLEFISDYGGINDVGGELKARNARVIKRGKGRASLKLARNTMDGVKDFFGGAGDGKKFGVDDVAMAAIEAGHMANDPAVAAWRQAQEEGTEAPDVVTALWAAIDMELRGQDQTVPDDAPDAAVADTEAALDGIEQYLSRLGVSLDDNDDAIRAAMEADDVGRQYGQGYIGDDQREAISAVLSGSKLEKPIVWRNTPAVLSALVGKDTPLVVMPSVIWKAGSDKHGLTEAEILTAIDGLADPVMAFDSDGTVNSIVFLVDSPDPRKPLVIAIHHDQKVGRLEVSRIASVHKKDSANSIVGWMDRGLTRYVNKRKADAWVRSATRQLRLDGSLKHRSGKKILQHRDVFKGAKYDQASLLFQGGALNINSDAFKSWFGDSKVVDADGKPLVVYHGTRADIDAFDPSRTGEATDFGWFGEGTYFTTNADEATNYATIDDKVSTSRRAQGSVYPVYLSVENPYITDESSLSADEVQALRNEGYDAIFRKEYMRDAIPREIVVFEPTQIKSIANRGTFDPNDPRILYQSAGPGPRGSIQFPAAGVGNGDSVIRLFQTADLSTMLHESGHYFLTVMQDLAARGEPNAIAEFQAVKDWWRANAADVAKDGARVMPDVSLAAEDVIAALDSGTTGDVLKDAAIDVGMQEQWARAFEAYLMEGKSPNVGLRSAFEKFRAWLVSIYKRLAGLNVTPSDELRRVFDRMLATDEEIAKAADRSGPIGPTFATAEAMGLSPEDYDAFMKLRARSEDEAKAKLLGEIMAPLKRERERWFKEERAKAYDEVEKVINRQRAFRAIEWMGNRRWLGEASPENLPDIRLSKNALVARYGPGVLKTLPRGMQTVYTVDGGIDPDEAAGWFGFGSGDEMIKAMETSPKRKDAIEAETDRVMREQHGDALNDGEIETIALDAVHTERRGEWIAAELKAVTEIAGVDAGMTAKEARATARATIARMRVRDAMAAQRFLAAERKAAEEAGRLGAILARDGVWLNNAKRRMQAKVKSAVKGNGSIDAALGAVDTFNAKFDTKQSSYVAPDHQRTMKDGTTRTIKGGDRTSTSLGYNDLVAKMIEAKRRQLLNHALYMEARAVADEVDKAENYVTRLNKKTTREKLAGAGRRDNAQIDYLAAIDEILDRYDFRKMSGKAEDRRGSLNAYVEAMTAAGRENELAIPESVLADAARKPYKSMPVEEMLGAVDTLKNLEHSARRWNDLIDAANKRKLDDAVAEIEAAFDANTQKRPPARVKTRSEALRNAGRQFLDLVLNAGTILREIDGFADMGAAYRNIKAPIDEAMNRLIVRKQTAAAALENLYAVYSKEDRRAMAVREHMPALGYALSKWERIAVALNLGNEGNRQRLTDAKVRGSLTDAQVDAVIATLDARDADFVQSVWDYVGSFQPDLAARERRTSGTEPKWVEASPVEIAGKTLRGGYYPIKYDARLSSLARDDQAQDIAQSLAAGRFGKAQTRNGHVKERAKSSGRDVELDMSVLHRHVNQVIYDLELSEAVSNSWRILQDSRIRSAFTDSGKQADFDALEIWLKDVAEGELRSGDLVGRGARALKSNFTAAKLAFNLSTVAVQITGLSQTMVVVGKKDFARGVKASLRSGVTDDIAAKSPYMATRQTTFNKDIYDFYNDPATGPVASRWGDIKKEIIGPLSFWLMTKVQWHLVDVPTWQGGYLQGMRRFGNDEAKAIAHADAIVKRAQASGLFPDRSAVERGSVSRTARQNDVVRLFTALGSYMFAKFNVAYERTMRARRTVSAEGVSARSAQEALSWALDMAFLFTFEAVLYAAIKGRLPDDEDDDDDGWAAFLAKETAFGVMGTIPGVRDVASVMGGFEGGGAYGAITKELAAPFTQVKQGEFDRALVKSVINATGLMTGLPSTQVNRAVDAGWRQAEGDDVSPIEWLLGRNGK